MTPLLLARETIKLATKIHDFRSDIDRPRDCEICGQYRDICAGEKQRLFQHARTAAPLLAAKYLEAVDNLQWILPMALAYAAANPVGSNQQLVESASAFLAEQDTGATANGK